MHTARLLTVSPSMHCTGGACSWGVPALAGVVSAPGGWYPSMHWGRPPCEQNSWHTLLKILPCPKLRLRAVKISRRKTKHRKDTHVVLPCSFFFPASCSFSSDLTRGRLRVRLSCRGRYFSGGRCLCRRTGPGCLKWGPSPPDPLPVFPGDPGLDCW